LHGNREVCGLAKLLADNPLALRGVGDSVKRQGGSRVARPNDTKFSTYEPIAHLHLPEEVRIDTGIVVVVVRASCADDRAALFEVADAEDSEIPAVSEPFPPTARISLTLSIFAYPDHRKIFEQRP